MKCKAFRFLIIVMMPLLGHTQSGMLDLSFGSNGIATASFALAQADKIKDIAIQADGKIIAVGVNTDGASSEEKIAIARFNSNGTLDNTFGTNGLVTTATFSNFNSTGVAVALQSDGKIVVGAHANYSGTLTALNGYFMALRYNTNGTLDNTFGSNGIAAYQPSVATDPEIDASDVLIQSDGKIIVCGTAYINTVSDMLFVRFNSNGSIDNAFGNSGVATYSTPTGDGGAQAMAQRTDGKIVFCGFIDQQTYNDAVIGRLNTNGTLDASFGTGGMTIPMTTASTAFLNIQLENNNNIVVCGANDNGALIAKFDADGQIFSGFGTNGMMITAIGAQQDATFTDLAIQTDGKIVAGGFADGAFALLRATSLGVTDNGFGLNGVVQTTLSGGVGSDAWGVEIQTDGKIVLGGTNITANPTNFMTFSVARYLGDINTTSTLETKLTSLVRIYPNPAKESFSIECDQFSTDDVNVTIHDMSGKLIRTFTNTSTHQHVDVRGLQEGIYQLRISSKNNSSYHKLIISK